MEDDPRDKPQAQGTPTGPATTPDYVSLREIGVGSYGRVWLVQDRTSGEYCAVKIIYRHLFEDEAPYNKERAGVQRFRELSTSSRSLLRIIHVGLHDEEGYFYYLMELADDRQTGQGFSPANYAPRTLKWELEKNGHRERLPAEDCLRIMLSLAAGLEELHGGGLIHRDIKPANIIFVRGEPKLADIGLVTSKDLTRTIVSTPGYYREGEPQSERSDIYGLGKVLYEMLTGLDRRDDVDFPRLPEDIRGWPDRQLALELNEVVSRACTRSPRKRYQSAKGMREDLERLGSGKSVRPRGRLSAGALGLGLVVAAGLLAVLVPLPFRRTAKPSDASTNAASISSQRPHPIDLTRYYNAGLTQDWHTPGGSGTLTLRKLPTGVQTFGGTSFHIQGIVQLSSPYFAKVFTNYPQAVRSIRIDGKCRKLHFLHGTGWNVPDGTQIGSYVLNYTDHQQHVFPIVYGADVRDWNVGSEPRRDLTRSSIVWTARVANWQVRLFKTTWENPMPENQLESIDFVSKMTPSAPFLIAVTVE